MAKQKQELAVIDKLEELKDYAMQSKNQYLLGRINRIIKEIKIDEINQSLEPVVVEANNPLQIEDAIKISEVTSENYHEADVDEKGVVKTQEESAPIIYKAFGDQSEKVFDSIENKTHEFANYQEEVQHIEQIPNKSEVTWESIYNDWDKHNHPQKNESSVFLIWLSTNYNVPTKKQ